jgi:hypothetical protein
MGRAEWEMKSHIRLVKQQTWARSHEIRVLLTGVLEVSVGSQVHGVVQTTLSTSTTLFACMIHEVLAAHFSNHSPTVINKGEMALKRDQIDREETVQTHLGIDLTSKHNNMSKKKSIIS